jgi:hypothetical protein
VAPAANVQRYCELSDQLNALDVTYAGQPDVIAQQAAALLVELPQVAPPEIRDAVVVVVDDFRAEAGLPGAVEPVPANCATRR